MIWTQLKIPGGLFCRVSSDWSVWRFCVVLPLRQEYHQNGAVFSLHPSERCMISICLIIDDVPFDHLKWCLPGVSPVKLLFPTLQLIISLWGDTLKHVNMLNFLKLEFIHWFISLSRDSGFSFCSMSSNPLQSSLILMLKLSLTWQVGTLNSCKLAYVFSKMGPHDSSSIFLLAGSTRCVKFSLSSPCSSPGFGHFSKDFQFLLAENGVWKVRFGY